MSNKPIKTALLSFLAGTLLTGSFWLGVENASYFKDQTETIPSQSSVSTPVSAVQQAAFLESNNPNVIAKMVEEVGPAVVKIETESSQKTSLSERDLFFRQFFGGDYPLSQPEQRREGLGSGFIISKDGYILTNHHVVEGAQTIRVNIVGAEKKYVAKIIGQDPELDLAVLKIDPDQNLPVLKMGDSDQIRVGEWTVAIGNPYGLDHSVTVGVLSAKQRPLNIGQAKFKNLLQTDASINPGNSGGPLLNLDGEVIGINTAINAEAQGIGFAIPINTVQEVLEDLIHKGKVSRPWLGVSIQDLTPELAKYFDVDMKEGVVIGYVATGSPAEKAGLKQGDIVIELDKQKMTSSDQFVKAIADTKAGSSHTLLIMRNGEFKSVTVIIGEKNYNSN
ncbi:trypsin-like peptidase domain-containing protein [Ammoniphilus sp. YIM 78166]|uniref:trypsin-like peptidase domain-containing protein n=1 Tax=Ammoniphilus sp. YIM 78166 TaxID=1644106 RepID=UPI00106F537B|nr:trypsin-like peptidase domain-containing protein [Ammoniphilus sp. YIM 78166]